MLLAHPAGIVQVGIYDNGDAKFITIQMQHDNEPEACTLDEATELSDALEQIVNGRKPLCGVEFGDRKLVVVPDHQPHAIAVSTTQCKHLISALRETVECAVQLHSTVDVTDFRTP